MKSIKKKIIGFFVGVLLLTATTSAVIYGLTYLNESKPTEEELKLMMAQIAKNDFTKYKIAKKAKAYSNVFPDKTNNDKEYYEYHYEFLKPMLKKVKSSYIVYTYAEEEGVAYAVSEERFNEMIEELYLVEEEYLDGLEDAKLKARYLIEHLTKRPLTNSLGYGTGKVIYWSYSSKAPGDDYHNVWRVPSAFDGAISVDEYKKQGTMFMDKLNILWKYGLSLDIREAAIQRIAITDLIRTGNYVMEVEAKVKTKRKSKRFDALDWVPDVGKTNKVTFILIFEPQHKGGTFINDIAVIKFKPLDEGIDEES